MQFYNCHLFFFSTIEFVLYWPTRVLVVGNLMLVAASSLRSLSNLKHRMIPAAFHCHYSFFLRNHCQQRAAKPIRAGSFCPTLKQGLRSLARTEQRTPDFFSKKITDASRRRGELKNPLPPRHWRGCPERWLYPRPATRIFSAQAQWALAHVVPGPDPPRTDNWVAISSVNFETGG